MKAKKITLILLLSLIVVVLSASVTATTVDDNTIADEVTASDNNEITDINDKVIEKDDKNIKTANKLDTKVNLNSKTTFDDTNITIPVSVKDSNNKYVTDGKVSLYLNNKLLGTNRLVNGQKNMLIFKLNPGSYTLKAQFTSDKYKTNSASSTLKILSKDTTINLNPITTTNTTNIKIPVAVKDATNKYVTDGKVTLYLDNKKLGTNTLTNGQKQMQIFKLNPGTYTLKAVYESNNYKTSSKTARLTIQTKNTILTLNSITTTNTTNIQIPVTVKDTNNKYVTDGKVTLYLNNKKLGTNTLTNGQKQMQIFKLNPGTYTLKAVYESSNYLSSSKTATLKINEALKDTKINIKTTSSIYYSNDSTIKASILTSDNKNVGSTGDILLYENSKLIGKYKVSNGNVTIKITKPNVGKHAYKLLYNSSKYKQSSKNVNIQVLSYSDYARSKKPYVENPYFNGMRTICSTVKLGGNYYHLGCGGLLKKNGYTQSMYNSRNKVVSMKCNACGHVFSDYKYDYTDFL